MTRTLRYLFLLLFLGVAGTAMAQSGGVVGKVLDEKKEPILGAIVEVSQGGITKGGNATDEDGNYIVKPLSPGRYDVKIMYSSYKTTVVNNVIVSPDKNTTISANLELDSKQLGEVTVVAYKVPLIGTDERKTITSEEIEKMPTRQTNAVVSTGTGVYQSKEGSAVNLGGARDEGTAYYVDGIRVLGTRGINLSQGSIDQVEVIQSGVSARYGDALGGVVNITTKGVSKQLTGGVLFEKSVDGYGHNLFNFNLSGPLVKKKVDSVTKKPIVGFRLDGDLIYDKDRSPTWYGVYQPKEDVLKQVQDKPLVASVTQSGSQIFNPSASYLHNSDFVKVKRRPNADITEGRINARLDFALSDNVTINAGGTLNYQQNRNYSNGASLYALNAIPTLQNYTARGYVRISQKFGKPQTTAGERKQLISNAYYTMQVDYQRDFSKYEHPDFGKDIFKYGYVGKFNTDYTSIYQQGGKDDTTGITGVKLILDHVSTKVNYERSDMNPYLANYTSQYFNEVGTPATNLQAINAQGGIINGYYPSGIYNRFAGPGAYVSGYGRSTNDQFAIGIDASFDLQPGKTRHAIEFGLGYQQRIISGYSANNFGGGNNLWQYARLLTNRHITLDTKNPIFIVGGKQYSRADVLSGAVSPSPFDTIYYNNKSSDTAQSVFDMNLRTKLGKGKTDYIDVDNYDPSTFSVNMFSADEMLNSGNPFVSYQGYDYTGNKLKGQVNFNDFFTKYETLPNGNRNYFRNIGSFKPSYISGYILDKFTFKDMNFNVGIRIDRYDANTKVLRDPYSLYAVKNVSQAKSDGVINSLNGGFTPGNIKDNYVVYVANNQSVNKSIIGYRDGDTWYDYAGKVIEDPTVLKNYSGGREPQPLLGDTTKITSNDYNPEKSFTDYKPQVNVMPRISFNFPIADKALFYAHYDVIVQRPSEGLLYASPVQYYYLTSNNQDIINNPDLKPQKLFDYEVGFKQELTKQSAITITAFYKERKDMIQVRPYLYAWPTTYYTYGNRDFSTTKGLTLSYDLRRVNHMKMNLAYTLQFADGTGSSSNSSASRGAGGSGMLQNFIQAGFPNLRFSNVLNIDSRHIVNLTMDYRYSDNEGPVVGGMHILQNAGVNFIFRTRSGEPYTKYAKPLVTDNQVEGGVNGSRLGWHYGLDMKVDKDFKLNKAKEGRPHSKELSLNAFVMINNVLNIKDITAVDGYTGRPDDDGYLTTPQGQLSQQTQISPTSYADYYRMSLLMGANNNINLPRRINLGMQLNF
jgi:outer membrane receptor protein involved in Fe transport